MVWRFAFKGKQQNVTGISAERDNKLALCPVLIRYGAKVSFATNLLNFTLNGITCLECRLENVAFGVI